MVNTKNQPLADELGCFNLFRSKWNCVVAVNSLQHHGLKCDFYSLGGFLLLFKHCFEETNSLRTLFVQSKINFK